MAVTSSARHTLALLWHRCASCRVCADYKLASRDTSGDAHSSHTHRSLILIAIVVMAALLRRWPFTLRAILLIGVTYLSGILSALYFGFTVGTGLLMLLVVVTCGLFFGRKWLYIGLLVTAASLTSVGTLHMTDVIAM